MYSPHPGQQEPIRLATEQTSCGEGLCHQAAEGCGVVNVGEWSNSTGYPAFTHLGLSTAH